MQFVCLAEKKTTDNDATLWIIITSRFILFSAMTSLYFDNFAAPNKLQDKTNQVIMAIVCRNWDKGDFVTCILRKFLKFTEKT